MRFPLLAQLLLLSMLWMNVSRKRMQGCSGGHCERIPQAAKLHQGSSHQQNERDIRAKLTTMSFPKSIHDTEGIADDILTYVEDRLHDVVNSHLHLETTWPGIEGKRNLGSRADGLFICVTVASEYIKASSDPNGALNDVLHGQATNAQQGPEAQLDILYLRILQRTPTLLYSIDTTKYVRY
jgi:hypothetical protein